MGKCVRTQNNEGKFIENHPSEMRTVIFLCSKNARKFILRQVMFRTAFISRPAIGMRVSFSLEQMRRYNILKGTSN